VAEPGAGPPRSKVVQVVLWTWEFGVGAVLPLADESWVFLEDCEENDNVEVGGDWGGKGMAAGSTFEEIRDGTPLSRSRLLEGECECMRDEAV
jgi:hypothetical protein